MRNIPPEVIEQDKKDGELALAMRSGLQKFWADLRQTDFFSQGILNANQFGYIFDKNKSFIFDYFQISTVEEFFKVFFMIQSLNDKIFFIFFLNL